MAIREYHYHDKKVMATILQKIVREVLTSIAHLVLRSWRVKSLALFLSKCIRLLYSVFKEQWPVGLSKHTENTICFDGITNLPNREAWIRFNTLPQKMGLFNFER